MKFIGFFMNFNFMNLLDIFFNQHLLTCYNQNIRDKKFIYVIECISLIQQNYSSAQSTMESANSFKQHK